MPDKWEELHNLVDLGFQFMEAVSKTYDSNRILLALGHYREDWQETVRDVETLNDRLEKPKNTDDTTALDEALARKSLHLVDLFAFAAAQTIGDDAFIFLPSAARSTETAASYANNHALNLSQLCARSLE